MVPSPPTRFTRSLISRTLGTSSGKSSSKDDLISRPEASFTETAATSSAARRKRAGWSTAARVTREIRPLRTGGSVIRGPYHISKARAVRTFADRPALRLESRRAGSARAGIARSEEHTSELQSHHDLV